MLRRVAEQYADQAAVDGVLDLRAVEFIGGGVADALLWRAESDQFTIRVSDNSVAEMLRLTNERHRANENSTVGFDELVIVST